jgi:FlaA1/EpsC-like NDP-sugar epimerase
MMPSSVPARQTLGSRTYWNISAFLADLVAFILSTFLAFQLRFDGALPSKYIRPLFVSIIVWAIAKTFTFTLHEVNRSQWKNTSLYDAQRITRANTLGSVLGGLAIVAILGPRGIPRSIFVLEWIISCFVTSGMRVIIRTIDTAKKTRWADEEGARTLIYGAGRAGRQLLRELSENRSLGSKVVGFIDDDPNKLGQIIDGTEVLGTGKTLGPMAKKRSAKRLLIAIPSATGSQLVRILKFAADAEIEHKMVPSLGDLIHEKDLGGQIRDIAVEDLLGRQSVELNQDHISERIDGKIVLVTGAAGSIGSELCRQIARFCPSAIIGFDSAETPLFQIERELRNSHRCFAFHPEIGSVTNAGHLMSVMKRYHPSIVYHAAAYKHVPLMEMHMFAAVENNILGTWQTALAAIEHGVEDFVLISTDKAVRPTSVMGASKRVAELAIRSLQSQSDTRFVAVRFGNVLGSNGSVVPIFKEQIASGGPVTVTHPEMRRYFMTISEAAQLVLQAFSFGKGGDVFLLDMGEPVKIADLARNLILLSGLKPDKDVKIQFTGLRPGEKLFEELNLHDESLLPTMHTKIRRYASPSFLDIATLQGHLQELGCIAEERDVIRLLLLLKNLVPDYTPSAKILEIAVAQSEDYVEKHQTMSALHAETNELPREIAWSPAALAQAPEES